MVYYDPQDLGWRPFVKSWMQRVGDKFKEETQVLPSGQNRKKSSLKECAFVNLALKLQCYFTVLTSEKLPNNVALICTVSIGVEHISSLF